MRIRDQLSEVPIAHQDMSARAAVDTAIAMLERTRIPEAKRRISLYPHEFSGGMRQRVMIAMALLGQPKLLFADEPTTALDVTVQAQILELLAELVRELSTSVVIVTHDLGVIARMCDRVIVLYGGRIMEETNVDRLFDNPLHPYSVGLLAATPRLDDDVTSDLKAIQGVPASLSASEKGCPFAPRCDLRIERCLGETPALLPTGDQHRAACHRIPGGAER